jgi:hypothetical protein
MPHPTDAVKHCLDEAGSTPLGHEWLRHQHYTISARQLWYFRSLRIMVNNRQSRVSLDQRTDESLNELWLVVGHDQKDHRAIIHSSTQPLVGKGRQ